MHGNPQPKSLELRSRPFGLADYQHHVKNLMAVIRSIAARTAQNSETVEEFMAHFDGRLAVLGRTQRMLARSEMFAIDLEELAHEELLSHAVTQPVTIAGLGVLLPQRIAENLALALHELFSNAVKFGALSEKGGALSLTWRADGYKLLLEWRESGVPGVMSDPPYGFGRDWLEHGLAYQISTRTDLQFLPGGVACTITLPLHLVALS